MAKKFWLVEHTYLMVHEFPAEWDADMVNFWANGSSHCADTEAIEIGLIASVGQGVCASCSAHRGQAVQGYDTLEDALSNPPKGFYGALAASPRARLERLLRDEILTQAEFDNEMKRLEAIEKAMNTWEDYENQS